MTCLRTHSCDADSTKTSATSQGLREASAVVPALWEPTLSLLSCPYAQSASPPLPLEPVTQWLWQKNTLFLHITGKSRTPSSRYFLLMSLPSLLAFLAWERALCCCPLHIYLLCSLAERKASGHCVHKYRRIHRVLNPGSITNNLQPKEVTLSGALVSEARKG